MMTKRAAGKKGCHRFVSSRRRRSDAGGHMSIPGHHRYLENGDLSRLLPHPPAPSPHISKFWGRASKN